MHRILFHIKLTFMQFWFWILDFNKPVFKVGDIVAAKQDSYGAPIVDPEYLRVDKVDKHTVFTSSRVRKRIYFNHSDLVKVELTDLEKVIHGVE